MGDAEVNDVAGLDRVTVWAGTEPSSLNATPGRPHICVSAQRSVTWTETVGVGTVDMKETRWQYGCTDGSEYTFHTHTWEAAAKGSIPTTVRRTVYEWGPSGWQVVADDKGAPASAAIDVLWRGTGARRPAAWVYQPGICYTYPPSVCAMGAGAAVERDASVTGTVQLSGLSADTAVLDHDAGRMRWWVSAGPLGTPPANPGVQLPRICYTFPPSVC